MEILQDLYDAVAEADEIGDQLSTAKQQLTERMKKLYREVTRPDGNGNALMSLETILDSIKTSAKQRGFKSILTGRTNADEREAELITWCRVHVKEYTEIEMDLMTAKAMIEISKATISQLTTDAERAQNKVKALRYALKHQTEMLRNETENTITLRTKDVATVLQAEGDMLLTKASMIESMSQQITQ